MPPTDDLRQAALAATPGPWIGCAHVNGTDPECACRYRGDISSVPEDKVILQLGVGPDHPDSRDEGSGWKSIPTPDRDQGYANGRYIALASPDRILALLSERDELRAALERLLANAEHIFDKSPVRDWGETLAEARAALEGKTTG